MITGLAAKALRQPEKIVPALLRRAFPKSKWGPNWKPLGGFWTFREDGFVMAAGPAALLARQHWEVTEIRRRLTGLRAATSLEIGCGYGRLSPTFAEFSAHHVAIDINPDALSKARAYYPAIDFRQASATELSVPDASMDLVVTWTVLQHIPAPAIDEALAEIRRVLKPGGTVLLCEATMYPDGKAEHIWDRRPEFYERGLPALKRVAGDYISELDPVLGPGSPGEVMLFR
jgi:SAM-dependent methyltransferase